MNKGWSIYMNKRFWLIFAAICLIFIVSCTPAVPEPTSTPSPLPPTPEPTPEPTLEETGCNERGVIERYELDSEFMNGPQYVSVYTPPCYDPGLAGGYSVLYTFHGQTFNDEMWFDLGAADYLDDMVLNEEAQPFLIVSIYEEFYYRAVRGNRFPDAVIQEIIPWVDSTFNTCAGRACRAAGGISRGAAWAMRLAFTNPDIFGAVGIHSLPSYLGGPDQLSVWIDEYPKDQLPKITMDSGRFDPEVKSAYNSEMVLNQKGIPHDWHLNEGFHDADYWAAHMEEYMRWYVALWGNVLE